MKLADLLEKRSQKKSELDAHATVIESRAAGEKAPEGEQAKVDALITEIRDLDLQIKTLQAARAAAVQDEPPAAPAQRTADGSAATAATNVDDASTRAHVTSGDLGSGKPVFRNLGENLRAIIAVSRPYTEGTQRANALNKIEASARASGHNEYVDSEGGFLLEGVQGAGIHKKVFGPGAGFVDKAQKIPVGNGILYTGKKLKDEDRRKGKLRGNVDVQWVGEGQSGSATKNELEMYQILLNKAVAMAYFTEEQIEDTPQMVALFEDSVAEAYSLELNECAFGSSGSPNAVKPKGMLQSAAKITISKESGQAAASILFENILNMYAASWGDVEWYINRECIPQLATMVMEIGTSGVPVFMPANGAAGKPLATLFGIPVHEIEHCEALGTEGDIVLCDPSQYEIVYKASGMTTMLSQHVKFVEGETALRSVARIGGRPTWDRKITPRKGNLLRSPYITLQTRA